MPDTIGFDPSQSTHAIDRCAANISFAEALPERIFGNIRKKLNESAKVMGLNPAPMISFRLDAASGAVIPTQEADNSAPVTFISPDQATQLFIAPNAISWATNRYVRWRPFVGEMARALDTVLDAYLSAVAPKTLRLDYVDSFFWTGGWEDFDIARLLKHDSGLLAARAQSAPKEWHTHSGWFSQVGKFRRLTGANIDVRENAPSGGLVMTPSVTITTIMQDEMNVPGYGASSEEELDKKFIFSQFETLHASLKDLLKDIVVEPMANRIGLMDSK